MHQRDKVTRNGVWADSSRCIPKLSPSVKYTYPSSRNSYELCMKKVLILLKKSWLRFIPRKFEQTTEHKLLAIFFVLPKKTGDNKISIIILNLYPQQIILYAATAAHTWGVHYMHNRKWAWVPRNSNTIYIKLNESTITTKLLLFYKIQNKFGCLFKRTHY